MSVLFSSHDYLHSNDFYSVAYIAFRMRELDAYSLQLYIIEPHTNCLCFCHYKCSRIASYHILQWIAQKSMMPLFNFINTLPVSDESLYLQEIPTSKNNALLVGMTEVARDMLNVNNKTNTHLLKTILRFSTH